LLVLMILLCAIYELATLGKTVRQLPH